MNKSGWYKLESFNAEGWSRGLAYFTSGKEAHEMSKKWLRIPSVVSVKISALHIQ